MTGCTSRRTFPLFIAFSVLAVAINSSVLNAYFLSDDFALIGSVAKNGFSCQWYSPGGGGFIRPVTLLSFLLDYRVWGLNPLGFHLSNALLHAANAFMVFSMMRHLLKFTGDVRGILVPVFAGAFFLVLPSHSEAVTWISGRTDVLSTTFGLAATLSFLMLVERFRWRFLVAFLTCFALSLLSKESAIVWPAIWTLMLVFLRFQWRDVRRDSIVSLSTSVVLLAAYFIMRKLLIGQLVGGYSTDVHLAFLQPQTLSNLAAYVLRVFCPPISFELYSSVDKTAVFVLLGVSLAAVAHRLFSARYRLATPQGLLGALLVVAFFVSLFPVLTLSVSVFNTEGERFLYLPSVFACSALAVAVALVVHKTKLVITCGLLLAMLGTGALWRVNERWITASQMTREIARELSKYDPQQTTIVNLPDNFRGAYVFRIGVIHAATTFQGREANGVFRILCTHDVQSLSEHFDASIEGEKLRFVPAEGRQVRSIYPGDGEVQWIGDGFIATESTAMKPSRRNVLSYYEGTPTIIIKTLDAEPPRSIVKSSSKQLTTE